MMPQTCPGSVISPSRVRLPRGLIALLVGLALSLGVVPRVPAATTWTVCASGCDYASIKAAIAAPTTLDGDTLALAAGTYTEAGIVVNKSLTLQGESAATTIVQAAASKGTATDRVFTIPSGVTVTLQALTIRYGLATGQISSDGGGGLYNQGTLTLINSTIRSNAASQDAGIENSSYGTLTLINSIVRDNVATRAAGGLGSSGTATLINSTVSGNRANGGACGGLCNGFGTLTLINSTVSGNSASSSGGGFGNAGTLILTHSTVSGNSAGIGGGLYSYGTVTLTHSTISGNSASGYSATNGGGGGGLFNQGTVTLTNSIVANNLTGGDCQNFDGASIISHGYNLDSEGSCQLTAPTDRPGVDPLLGPLQDNGGLTFTQALLPGSPAIDTIPWGTNGCGTTLVSDQRWQARPQPAEGPCDIGAYEVEVAGQALSGWVTGFTPHTVVCQNVTTGHEVTLSDPTSPWDCEAAGLGVTPGDRVTMHVRGRIKQRAPDIGGAVVGMTPTSGSCTNLTTGQQAPFQHMVGATAASCVAAGLIVHPGDHVQLSVQGEAE